MTGPPNAAEAPVGATVLSALVKRNHHHGTACPHSCCTSVDEVASDLLRSVSPLAEYVSRRVEREVLR